MTSGFVYYNFVDKDVSLDSNEPILLIKSSWPGFIAFDIAQEKGFFEENGVLVKVNTVQEYQDMVKGFKEGEYDGFFGVYTEALSLNSKDSPLKVVYVADFSDGADTIYSRSNIESVRDLKGKTISVYDFNDFSFLFVLALLDKFGLEEGDVNFVVLPSAEVFDSIKEGKIDAGISYTKTEDPGEEVRVLITSADTPKIITDVLALKSDIVENRPREVQAIVDSLFMGLDFVENNKQEAYEIESRKTGLSIDSVDGIIKWLKLPDREENQKSFGDLEHSTTVSSLRKSGEFIGNFLIEKQIIDEKVNLDELLDSRFVEDKLIFKDYIFKIIMFAISFGVIGFLIGNFFDKRRRR